MFSFITIFLSTKHSNWILWVFLCSRTGLQQDWKNGGKRKDLCLSQSGRQFWLRVWIKLESNAVLMAFRRQDSLNEGKSIYRHTLTYQRGGVCVTVFAMMKQYLLFRKKKLIFKNLENSKWHAIFKKIVRVKARAPLRIFQSFLVVLYS